MQIGALDPEPRGDIQIREISRLVEDEDYFRFPSPGNDTNLDVESALWLGHL